MTSSLCKIALIPCVFLHNYSNELSIYSIITVTHPLGDLPFCLHHFKPTYSPINLFLVACPSVPLLFLLHHSDMKFPHMSTYVRRPRWVIILHFFHTTAWATCAGCFGLCPQGSTLSK